MIRVLYFARLRDAFACSEESLAAPATVAELIAILAARGGVWADELSAGRVFRVAINQEMASMGDKIPAGAEVAIFPPVTGG